MKRPEPISESELDQRYRDMLDEVYGEVTIAGLTYQTSDALESVDPTAYRCGFSDWLDDETLIEVDGEYFNRADWEEYQEALEEEEENES